MGTSSKIAQRSVPSQVIQLHHCVYLHLVEVQCSPGQQQFIMDSLSGKRRRDGTPGVDTPVSTRNTRGRGRGRRGGRIGHGQDRNTSSVPPLLPGESRDAEHQPSRQVVNACSPILLLHRNVSHLVQVVGKAPLLEIPMQTGSLVKWSLPRLSGNETKFPTSSTTTRCVLATCKTSVWSKQYMSRP